MISDFQNTYLVMLAIIPFFRFQDENEHMKVLEDFTLSGCQFECALKRSQEKCHCIPWNYPRPDADRSDLCDLFGNACFNNEMKKVT